jgi:hypothetical protein
VVGEVLPLMAQAGRLGKLPKCAIELFEQAVRSGETVFRDEFPDLLKVRKSATGQFELVYLGCSRRSALKARSWRKASSPSIVSPRSISSRPSQIIQSISSGVYSWPSSRATT